MLRSVVTNRQFPQCRCFQAGWVERSKCIFCLHAAVSGEVVDASSTAKQRDEAEGRQHRGREKQRDEAPSFAEGSMDKRPPSPLHTKATKEQVESTPVGTLAHRNYGCKALAKERAKHAPDYMMQRVAGFAAGDLALERALHPAIVQRVPPPHADETFE